MLGNFKMQDILALYKILNKQLQDQVGLKKRFKIKDQIDFSYSDEENSFILHFNRDTARILAQVKILDREIARRNKLIGVMG